MGQHGDNTGTNWPTGLDTASAEIDSPSASKTKARAAVPNDISAAVVSLQNDLRSGMWVYDKAYPSLQEAITAASGKTLILTKSWTLSSNTSIGATVSIFPFQSGIINSGGHTLTINGPVVGNPMHQWLSGFGVGDVKFGNLYINKVFVDWFGDKSEDCYTPIMVAIYSLLRGGKVIFGKGIYKTSNTININISLTGVIELTGVDDTNTIIVHTGNQTTGAIYVESPGVWGGSSYIFNYQTRTRISKLSVGSSYGPAISTYLALLFLDDVTTFSAGSAYSNVIYRGAGGRINKTFFNSSQSGFSYSPYHDDVVALLPLGAASLITQNNFTIVSTTFNDGVHGAEEERALELWITNSGSGCGSTGPSILIGLENGATIGPAMIHFNMCKFTGGTQVGGGNEPVVVKIKAGQQIFFDHCNFEPTVISGTMTSVETDAIDGDTEVYFSNCFQESNGTIDVGDFSDTTTTRTYKTSLHVDHCRFNGIKLNSKMITDGNILDLILSDTIFNNDIANLVGTRSTIPNINIRNCFYGISTRTPVGNIFQTFIFYIYNSSGIKHLIASDEVTQSVAYYSGRINGATNSPTTTQTGTDSSTAMTGGGKISSVNTERFIFDNSKDQLENSEHALSSIICLNSTGTALTVTTNTVSRNVNGTTMKRIELKFANATTGGVFDLTSLASGKEIMVRVTGYMF